eukprot:m.712695 g.712695  ORF g.712695 m.712695 type:complete len:436 (+) comp22965_c0_seq2:114-1421(+)
MMMRSQFCAVLLGVASMLFMQPSALENGLARTPPRGWRSWNCDHGDVNDTAIRKVIDAMVSRKRVIHDGSSMTLFDLGFTHVGVDDGWQACETGRTIPDKHLPNNGTSFHDDSGKPLVNATKFPSLKSLVDYGHSKNVSMGWYDNNCICMDEYTLRADAVWAQKAYLGDVQLLLDAGFDSVKIDNCGDDDGSGFKARIAHIKAQSKPILVENSNQGNEGGPPRGNPNNTLAPGWCDFNFYRSGGDIGPDFGNIMAKLQRTIPYQDLHDPLSRPGCWAYPDMLEVGNFRGPLNLTESRTHFGAWCIVSSPLILGLDVTSGPLVDEVWPIISNLEAHAVNQAWFGHPGRQVLMTESYQIWAKPLAHGSQAVLAINTGAAPVSLSVAVTQLNITAPGRVAVRDLWTHTTLPDLPPRGEWSVQDLGSHDSAFVTLTPQP